MQNKGIRQQKDGIGMHFQDLKSRMNTYRENQAQRLTDLTLNSNKAIKELKAKQEARTSRQVKLSGSAFRA